MKIYQIFEYRRLTFVNVLYWWAAAVCLTRRSQQQHQSIMSWDACGTSVCLPPTQQDITCFTRQGIQAWCKGKKKKWNMQKIQQIFFLSPTDDTDEHGYSFYRTRISRMNTDFLFTEHGCRGWTQIFFLSNTNNADWHGWFLHNKNIKEQLIAWCSVSIAICEYSHWQTCSPWLSPHIALTPGYKKKQ